MKNYQEDTPATTVALDAEVMKAHCPYCGMENKQVWVSGYETGRVIAESTCDHFVMFFSDGEFQAQFKYQPEVTPA